MNAMQRYRRDEYEDLDEYETDGEEEEGNEDGYEDEEVHQPTEEELNYLEYRQKKKEEIRKKLKTVQGNANSGSRNKFSSVRKDNFGSFFGPSQPVIAQRVLEESKSLLENPHLAAKISKPHNTNNKNQASTSAAAKPRVSKPINVVKKKVEILKSNRNYSFLLSDDAEIPAPLKSPPPRNMSNPNFESRSAPIQSRSKHVVNERGRDVANGHDGRKPVLSSSQSRPKPSIQRTSQPLNKSPIESRKQPASSHSASGPGRPNGLSSNRPNGLSSNRPATANRVSQPVSRNLTNGDRRPASSQQPIMRKPGPSHSQLTVQRPSQSRPQQQSSSISRSKMVQRNTHQQTSRPIVAPRQSLPSRYEEKRPPPKVMSRGVYGDQRRVVGDQRPKPKPTKRPFESDDEDAMSMLRKMLPKPRYHDDGDDSDMEANFDEIQMEEDRSSRIAKKEDAEQARLLELEEERRRMRLAKKRKMGH